MVKSKAIRKIAKSVGDVIRIRGARVHNLQNVSLDIPRDALTVVTGVSGSGKSSLAFDTLYAEGQRQYIDSLSAYARQFLDQIPRPDVDSIDGLAPTLAIDQKAGVSGARSTVATISEIYDYLRLMYARVGTPHCGECGSAIAQQSAEVIRESLAGLPQKTKIVLLAPMVRGRRGVHREVFEEIRKSGLIRVRVDGETHLLEDVPPLAPKKNHTIEAVVDRLVIREGVELRLGESLDLALKLGSGLSTVLVQDKGSTKEDRWNETIYSTAMACVECNASFEEIEPRTFSFNSPYGACDDCDGLGVVGDEADICATCNGARLRSEALAVTIAGLPIHKLTSMPLDESILWFRKVESSLSALHKAVASPITREVIRRLEFLIQVGVPYLTLHRQADTLSGGELQRVRLATSIGSGLVGVCYVLDEPSIGLHPADHDRLLDCLRELQTQGNTVVVVEHDEATMRAADFLVDIGPQAGKDGGKIISQGTPSEVMQDGDSLTGKYLKGTLRVTEPGTRRKAKRGHELVIKNVTTHNLKNVTATFPLGLLIGVSGVSGSGKSSLVNDTLYPALAKKLGLVVNRPGPFRGLTGGTLIDKLIPIDQTAIGRSARSCPATYSGALDEIRKLFAATKESKTRGFSASRFSFNSAAGRCELCKGHGVEKIEMNFLSDLHVPCTRCGGKRFNRQTLQVRFKDANVADVLGMSIDQAAGFFENVSKLSRLLKSLQDVGLGYLHLGQSSTTLSGGEAQRIKLGTELARTSTGKTLYLLDEPTTGLHFADVQRLANVLQRLVEAGNTVLVIEHNFDLLAACDWMIDLGPTGGKEGGQILAEGTPEQIAALSGNATGRYLRQSLAERVISD
ncbi:excinuclease ABC subunit UvrA [Rhodopirellula sp.]|nr:excinuclease ABC subunit UvrA [Rubripirellula sp.]MDA7873678.1 excinuclease ABC subunit UvrA [Rhodopirellula sp.]MDB4394025.1 excinuclease ABC subunit UvrA [Rhodopirellula sp.]MDB4770620.1 excinuclease ABC subunit UvrA [bacterium]